jgi:hypothetical protein
MSVIIQPFKERAFTHAEWLTGVSKITVRNTTDRPIRVFWDNESGKVTVTVYEP